MFKNNFIKFCNDRGLAPSAVCMAVGLSNSAFSSWTEESVPRKATLMKLADYLGCTVDDLLADDPAKKKPLTETDEELDKNIVTVRGRDGSYSKRRLTDEQIAMLKTMIDSLPDVPDDL